MDELTEQEIYALEIMQDQLCLPLFSTKVSRVAMNSLNKKGYVEISSKREIEFWILTDKGTNYENLQC
jgi:hypothetical protein